MITKRLQRLLDYWKDKRLADKCGLKAKDICVHESDGQIYHSRTFINKCIKCGEFYR